MATILHSAVHEAGHVVMTLLHGLRIEGVYIGPIWLSDPDTDFVSLVPKLDGRVRREEPKDESIRRLIKGAGPAAETMWKGNTKELRDKILQGYHLRR